MIDVAIVGAGVIGCAVARELSRYRLDIVVLEKGPDVASGTSKANSGIVHAGYDAKPGTLKAKFNVQGQRMFDRLAQELDFPFKRCGSLVIALSEKDIKKLEEIKARGIENGLSDLEILDRAALQEREPQISEHIPAALYVPSGGIAGPYEMTIAYGENAAVNGIQFLFQHQVLSVEKQGGRFLITTGKGKIESRYLINAAGVHAGEINNMLSRDKIETIPRIGEYCLLDKTEGGLVGRTIFQLPTDMGKGVLVTPTVDGNILVGPTSRDIRDPEDVSTTRDGLEEALKKGSQYVRHLPRDKIITSFAGIRAHSVTDDFIIGESPDVPGLINLCGIESPGLSSAPAIAKAVEEIVVSLTKPETNRHFQPERKAPPRFRHLSNSQRSALIAQNPDYGRIVCRCESVTKGEIIDALRSPLKIRDLDAIKRRTRAGMGRCQAGFCHMRLLEIVARELGIPITQVTKNGDGTRLLLERNKASLAAEGGPEHA